jgi:hypothetical protein
VKGQALVSRRRFIGQSLIGCLGTGLAYKSASGSIPFPFSDAANDAIELKVVGDEKTGYGVALSFRGQVVARHNGGGEFSAIFQNEERSLEDRITDWKATSYEGDAKHVTLSGVCNLKNSNATVFVKVQYDVIDSSVVRKSITLHQSDIFLLYHQIANRLEPVEAPVKFWSFDQQDCRGGDLHENFPAAGFLTSNELCVGLLTDSGFRNGWSRIVRRDGKPVKPAPRAIPDPSLSVVPSVLQRQGGQHFVQQTFGELLEQLPSESGGQAIALPLASLWRKRGETSIEQNHGAIAFSASSSGDGIIIPFSTAAGAVYSVRLEYRSKAPIAVQIWDVDDKQQKLQEMTLFNDTVPASGAEWSEFRNTVYIPSWKGAGGAIYISFPESEQGTATGGTPELKRIEVRGLELRRVADRRKPYHRLEMDRPLEKTVFIFVDEQVADTLRGYRMASQIHLANALHFQGSDTEKILYADLMMLCWNADTQEFRPMLAPSIVYSAAGEMYLRDSFFALNGIHNRELNEGVFRLWAENQGEDGAINTLVEPNMANLERKSNDSTPLWLMWAFLNRKRFGTELPAEKVRKAAEYFLRTYDRHHDAGCWAQFVMGQLDVINYPEGTSEICENQGIFAVTLRVIKELKVPGVSENISEDYLQKAEQVYRSYYDPVRKFIVPARGISDAIGFAELFPEFLSLWLHNRKILSDEMVVNHLERIPALLPSPEAPYPEAQGTVRPIFIGIPDQGGWSYFAEEWHPMISDTHAANYARHAMDGVYYNGGSWMRIEVCGYVTGLQHGWNEARKAIANRLWAEINISRDFPTSQEYLATSTANPFFGYHRVFAWNSFVLQALELAGMRSSDMDPDFVKKQTERR